MLHPYLSSAIAEERRSDRLREAERFRLARLARASRRRASRPESLVAAPAEGKRTGGWLASLLSLRPRLSRQALSVAPPAETSLAAMGEVSSLGRLAGAAGVGPALALGERRLTSSTGDGEQGSVEEVSILADRFPAAFDRRAGRPAEGTGARVVACIEVDPIAASGSLGVPSGWEALAAWHLGRRVRANDCVSWIGGTRLAVQFGYCAERVAPAVLGHRLIRAMGEGLNVRDTTLNLDVAVGIGTSTSATTEAELMRETMVSLDRLPRRTLRELNQPLIAFVDMPAPRRQRLLSHDPSCP